MLGSRSVFESTRISRSPALPTSTLLANGVLLYAKLTIDLEYRCEDGHFLVSAGCVTISSSNSRPSSKYSG